MQIEDRIKKAVELVTENAKQLIAVAAGILTFTVTFYEKLKSHAAGWSAWLLVAAWLAYLVSIWCGFLTIDGITAALSNLGREFTVFERRITMPARVQRYFFLLGTVLVLAFGAIVIAMS